MKDLLPIGSVVLLKEAGKSLMIVGILQKDETDRVFDYIAVLFPEGYLDAETFFLFNHEDIADVRFVGCINAESQTYTQLLKNQEFNESSANG